MICIGFASITNNVSMSRGILKKGSGCNVKDDVLSKRKELRVESYKFFPRSRVSYRLAPWGPTKIVKALSASVSHQRCANKENPLDSLHGSCVRCVGLQEELCPNHM